jgi:hypothetical protein
LGQCFFVKWKKIPSIKNDGATSIEATLKIIIINEKNKRKSLVNVNIFNL